MGPIEIAFVVIVIVWGCIGVIRGFTKELGITLMMLVGLWVMVFVDAELSAELNRFLAFVAGPDVARQKTLQAVMYCGFMIVLTFLSYQGVTLIYPGSARNSFLSVGVGLINGYLLAGTLWYYLACADWPFLDVVPPYNDFYYAVSAILPPQIFTWPFLIGLIVLMLILRIVK